jgi:hypothetical protein
VAAPVAGPPSRVYVGSVYFDISEDEIKQVFQYTNLNTQGH